MSGRTFHLGVGVLQAVTAWYFFEAARSRETLRVRPWMSLTTASLAAVFALWHLRQWQANAPAAPSGIGPTSPVSPAPTGGAPLNPDTLVGLGAPSPTPTTPLN